MYIIRMKTTIDIPVKDLEEAIHFAGAKTKREAVLAALTDFNRRHKMARLSRHLGTCNNLMTPEELNRQRESN